MRRVAQLAIAVALILAPSGMAMASEGGSLVVVPPQGTLDTPMDVITSGECPRGVTFVVAVRGEGIDPATSGNAVGNTNLDVLKPPLYSGRHTVPLARTLREFFISNGVGDPRGEYELVFACRNRLDFEDLFTFTATVDITRQGYQALDSAATPLEEWLASQPDPQGATGSAEESIVPLDVTQGGAMEEPRSDDVTTADASSPTSAVEPAREPTVSSDAANASQGLTAASANPASPVTEWMGTRLLFLLGGLALLVLAGSLWWRQRRSA